MTNTMITMATAVASVQTTGSPSQVQDVRKAKSIFTMFGIEGEAFDAFPADIHAFEAAIPRFSKRSFKHHDLIEAGRISNETYKQNWRAAKRLIENGTGETARKAERRTRQDDCAKLLEMVDALVAVGLLPAAAPASLTTLIDCLRATDTAPRDLTAANFEDMRLVVPTRKQAALKKGLKLLNELRTHAALADLLPASLIRMAEHRVYTFPDHLVAERDAWIDQAARQQVEPAFNDIATPNSASDCAIYRAALGCLAYLMERRGLDLATVPDLPALLRSPDVTHAIRDMENDPDRSARTHFGYASKIALLMERNGMPEEAAGIRYLIKNFGHLQQGANAGKQMGRKQKRWCQELIRSPEKTGRFLLQHLHYFEIAKQAYGAAAKAGINLQSVSDPTTMQMLSEKERGVAKMHLNRVRMFGTVATYAAIALEGSPFRRQNMLSIRHKGLNKTLFDHIKSRDPHVVIKFPNSELKNHLALDARGEELEPIEIRTRDDGDHGLQIITWYLAKVRPLFPEAAHTDHLFPHIKRSTNVNHLSKGTFGNWLEAASAEIGLRLTSHKFRHGYCSIEINYGNRSFEDLAKVLGDSPATVRRNYAWIDGQQSVANVQNDVAARRAEIARQRRRT